MNGDHARASLLLLQYPDYLFLCVSLVLHLVLLGCPSYPERLT